MDTIGQAKAIIREQLEAHGWTGEHLAKLAGLSQSTLSRFMRDTTDDVRFSTLQAIAGVLGLTLSQLIGEEPINGDPKLRQVRMAMQRMPEYVKDAVVDLSVRLADTPAEDA